MGIEEAGWGRILRRRETFYLAPLDTFSQPDHDNEDDNDDDDSVGEDGRADNDGDCYQFKSTWTGPSEYPLLEQNSEFFVLLEPYSDFFGKWPSSE